MSIRADRGRALFPQASANVAPHRQPNPAQRRLRRRPLPARVAHPPRSVQHRGAFAAPQSERFVLRRTRSRPQHDPPPAPPPEARRPRRAANAPGLHQRSSPAPPLAPTSTPTSAASASFQRRRFRDLPLAFPVPIADSPLRHRGPPCPWSSQNPRVGGPRSAQQRLPPPAKRHGTPPPECSLTKDLSHTHPLSRRSPSAPKVLR